MLYLKLKTLMLGVLQKVPVVLNLLITLRFALTVILPEATIPITYLQLLILGLIDLLLLLLSKTLGYCIWHRLYIYLLLLFLIFISIWFCDLVFILHSTLLLILISLCIYFKKGYVKCNILVIETTSRCY